MARTQFIIGIDEAGRGPLAGPVAVGVVAVPIFFDIALLKEVRDSKQLTAWKRDVWFYILEKAKKDGILRYAVGLSSAKVIDTKGIVPAIREAMEKALNEIAVPPEHADVRLDGSLYAPPVYQKQTTIIKGDEKEPIISLASIAAKVTRDRYMQRVALKHPEFTFAIHKGYGTKAHREEIIKTGLSPLHRRSFCRNIA